MITKERIHQILCEVADGRDPAGLRGNMTLDDLGYDSLTHLELVMAFEEEMEIDITDDDVDAHFTFGKPVSGVVEYLLSRKP